jgi:hypothetical protein
MRQQLMLEACQAGAVLRLDIEVRSTVALLRLL